MALIDNVREAIEEGDGDFPRETVHLLIPCASRKGVQP
jgi:hypothetical protein